MNRSRLANNSGDSVGRLQPASSRGSEVQRRAKGLPPAVATEVIFDDGCEKVTIVGNCVVTFTRPKLTVKGVSAVARAFAEVTQSNQWIAYLAVIVPEREGADETVEREMARVISSYDKHISGLAIMYRGTGFIATRIRSSITAIHHASQANHPLSIFEELEPALAWLKHFPQNDALDAVTVGEVVRKMMR